MCKLYIACVNSYTNCVNSRCFVANLPLFRLTRLCVKFGQKDYGRVKVLTNILSVWDYSKHTLGTIRYCIVLGIESSLHSTTSPKFNRLPCSASVVIEFHNFTQSFCNARIFQAVHIVHTVFPFLEFL